jgi:hypothetical protein
MPMSKPTLKILFHYQLLRYGLPSLSPPPKTKQAIVDQ